MKRTLTKSIQVERRLFERRRFHYSDYMPERRSGRDRRTAEAVSLDQGAMTREIALAARKIARF